MVASALLALNLSYWIWYTGLKRLGGSRTSVYSYLTPIVAMIVAGDLARRTDFGQPDGRRGGDLRRAAHHAVYARLKPRAIRPGSFRPGLLRHLVPAIPFVPSLRSFAARLPPHSTAV